MAGAVSTGLRLESHFDPADGLHGSMSLRLLNDAATELAEFRLAITTVVQLTPPANNVECELVARLSGYHELEPTRAERLLPGATWESGPLECGHRPGHANDGPASAFVIRADGSTAEVEVARTTKPGAGPAPAPPTARVREPAPPLRLADPSDVAAGVWQRVSACERAVHGSCAAVLGAEGDPVTVGFDASLPPDAFRLIASEPGYHVRAGSERGFQHALIDLVRRRRGELDLSASAVVAGSPRYGWRGLHIDLARQFLNGADVGLLIELAGWHRLNRLHLHLTDDEGWRLPIAGYPAVTAVGGWRGHGLAIPPLLGTGAAPSGGSYTAEEIASWVHRANELGIELIPEVDVPGHCFAALAAVPELRDPDDASGAISVQHFVDNVLNPGMPATMPFLDAVLGEVADLFPGRWIHLGGDEVALGAWSRSPAAARYATARGIDGTSAIQAAFMREVIELARASTGRSVGVWQEAAECGALRPGDGYVVGWRSLEDCRRLAAAGHQLVASPAEAYYLDMAEDDDWWSPGTSWAGATTVDDIVALDPTDGWTPAEVDNLLGVQACLWTEHVHDCDTLRRLLLDRLTAVADRCWTA
jgi:hexosaminidase